MEIVAVGLTHEQARNLRIGDVLHQTGVFGRPCDSRNGPIRWRVNGRVITWKRDPDRYEVPIKHGLRSYGKVTSSLTSQDMADLHLESECPHG